MEDEQATSYTRKLCDLLDEYEAAVRAARARKTPGSGLLGLGPKGSDDPCHEAFDSKLAALFAAMAAGDVSVGDAAEAMPRLYRSGVRPDVIVTDPPRAGCTPVVLETFARMQPQRIVYVSCNPATLARDLAILDGLGYGTEKIQPVDMFPMTSHVESVALVTRKAV